MRNRFQVKSRLLAGVCAAMLTLAGVLGLPGCGDVSQQSYVMATATVGGTYYPVGVAIATLATQQLEERHQIRLSAISSAGSEENIRLMRLNEAQFSILQGVYGAWAWYGDGPLEGNAYRDLRAVCMLWPNVEHFVVRSSHAPTGSIDDLRGFGGRFSIGARNSGTEGSGRHILGSLGVDVDGMDLAYQGYGPSAESLQNGTIMGMNTPAGVPVSAVTQVFAAMGDRVRILSFNEQHLGRINARYEGLWSLYRIQAGTYPNQGQTVQTVAHPNFLAVRADVDDHVVYAITRAMFENLPELYRNHEAARAIQLATALDGLPVPLHPGALRYFEEVGLEVPDRLRPQQADAPVTQADE